MGDPRLTDVLDLELLDRDLFRANLTFPDVWALYGGQVAAQALLAAGLTVDAERQPHSLHGYFLRAGDSSRPTVYQVFRDRDGGSYSARRVVALQEGEVIFSLAASFHVEEGGADVDEGGAPATTTPAQGAVYEPPRLFGMEGRTATEDWSGTPWPTRFWARSTEPLATPLLHACALTYLSDISTGLTVFNSDAGRPTSSLDHALWFHRPADLTRWVLADLVPQTAARGRGWYTGGFYDEAGVRLASMAQETLFRPPRL